MKFIPQFEINDKVIDFSYGYGRIVNIHDKTVRVKFDEKNISNTYRYHKKYNQYISAYTHTSLFSCESIEIKQYHQLCEENPLNLIEFKRGHWYSDIRLNLRGILVSADDNQLVIKYRSAFTDNDIIVRYSRTHFPQILFDYEYTNNKIYQLRNCNLHLCNLKPEYLSFTVDDNVCTKDKGVKLCGKVCNINYLTKPITVFVANESGVHYKCNVNQLIKFSIPKVTETITNKFKPFDKVLVRDNDDEYWYANFFSHGYYEDNADGDITFWYRCVDHMRYLQCIPYEGNEKLVGTRNEPK
jgi:hypothetical protein|nr:MAG TPA: hypothetical protein [Caudoviricetes sp.]